MFLLSLIFFPLLHMAKCSLFIQQKNWISIKYWLICWKCREDGSVHP